MSWIRKLSLDAKAADDVDGLEDGQHHLRRVTPGLLGANAQE